MIASIVLCAGCFWSVELLFQRVPGVVKTSVGYAGVVGTSPRRSPPSYQDVLKGDTGLCEAVKIDYDENILSTDLLLDIFLKCTIRMMRNVKGYVTDFILHSTDNVSQQTHHDRNDCGSQYQVRCSLKTRNNKTSFDRKFSQI